MDHDYTLLSEQEIDAVNDIEQLRALTKNILTQLKEENDEQIEQRIMSLEAVCS